MFAVRVALVRAVGTEVLAQQAVWRAKRVGANPVARLSQQVGAIPVARSPQQVGAELRVPAVSPEEAPQRREPASAQAKWPAAVALPAVQRAAPIPRARPATQ